MNRTSTAIRPREFTATIDQFKAGGIVVLDTEVMERARSAHFSRLELRSVS